MTVYVDAKPAKSVTSPFDVVIKRGIPMPESYAKSNSKLYGIAAQMQIGDCIDIPYSRSGTASNLARAFGYEFTQRKVDNVLRIWRTA